MNTKLDKIIDILNPEVKPKLDNWTFERITGGYIRIKKRNKYFSIEDYHVMRDYTGPMKFKSMEEVERILRFLNNYYKGKSHICHWTIYNRIENQLNIKSGVYDN